MKKYRKILSTLTLLLLCFTLAGFPAFGAAYGQSFIRDNGDVLSDAEEAALSAKLEEISRELACDVAVITVRTLNGRDVQRYAHELYDIHGYGQGAERDGILLLISVTDRRYALSVNGFAHRELSDKALDRLEDGAADALSADDYVGAVDRFADDCRYLLGLARDGKRYNPFPWIIIPISLIMGFVIALFCVSAMKRKLIGVRPAPGAASYIRQDSLVLRDCRELYLYSTVTKIPRPKNGSRPSSDGRASGTGRSGGSRGSRSGRF